MTSGATILITGASGRTGRAVISALNSRGAPVRAFIRREETADELRQLGATEIALGDLFDEESLAAAVTGCDQVIHICPPMNSNEAKLGKAMINLCLDHGIRRLILYSVLHPLLSDVRHHHLKLEAEEYLVKSGQVYTILQPARYMQHLNPIWKDVLETGMHRMPFSADARFSLVDLLDLADAAAIILTEDGHEAATYQLAGPHPLNQHDMAQIITEVTGTKILAAAKPLDEFRESAQKAGLPADRIEQLCNMNAHYDHHGLIGNPNILRWILGREPNDFATYLRREFGRE